MSGNDMRTALRESLSRHWGLVLSPRGVGADQAVLETERGHCASPVVVEMPDAAVQAFSDAEGVDHLAMLIAEAVDTDTTTQLVRLTVGFDWLRRPELRVERR